MAEVVAYHVDRIGQLAPGQVIDLEPPPGMPAGGPDLTAEWNGQVSRHGAMDAASNAFDGSVVSEWLFEMVRRAEFGEEVISRFQSVFAFPTLAAARGFRINHCGNAALPIVRVRGEEAHRANMALIRWSLPAATTLARAREYWRGEAGAAVPAVWELLLRLPVTVLGPVGEDVASDDPHATLRV